MSFFFKEVIPLRYTVEMFTDEIQWYLEFASKSFVKRKEVSCQGTDEIRVSIS